MVSASEIRQDVERLILRGQMVGGERLPSVRALADQYGAAPGTVAAAYRQLVEAGLIIAGRGRQGTRVAHSTASLPSSCATHGVNTASPRHGLSTVDARHGAPDPSLLPSMDKALRHAAKNLDVSYGSAIVNDELRAAAERSFQADGIPAQSLTITNGAMDAIDRAIRTLHLRVGDRVVVEDPGHLPVHQLVRSAGLTPVPVTVDEYGVRPDEVEKAMSEQPSAVVITPRAQNPTGGAFDRVRAMELSEIFAQHPDVLLIQDDHAGLVGGVEYHQISITGPKWLTVRSVGKELGPDLRLATATGDQDTIDRMSVALSNGPGWVSHLLQRTAAFLMTDPVACAEVKEAAATYRARRLEMLHALRQRGVDAVGRSGFNVWVPVLSEQGIVEELSAKGYAVAAGDRWRINSPSAVRISVSMLQSAEIEGLADALAATRRRPVRHGPLV